MLQTARWLLIFACLIVNFAYGQSQTEEIQDKKLSVKKQVEQGKNYLSQAWLFDEFKSQMSSDLNMNDSLPVAREIFTMMMILNLIGDLNLDINLQQEMIEKIKNQETLNGLYYFFEDHSLMPPDVDDTSLAIILLTKTNAIDVNTALLSINQILTNCSKEGIIEVYFDPTGSKKGRMDPAVCANALYAITLYGKEQQAQATEDFLFQVLDQEDYIGGTRYYVSADAFLYFLSYLVADFPQYQARFLPLLQEKLLKRIGTTDHVIELAMRVIAAENCGLNNEIEKEKLLAQQLEDGSWPSDAFFKGAIKYAYFGSPALSTAFVIRALSSYLNEEGKTF